MKVLVCGGRDFNIALGVALLTSYFEDKELPTEVIHGNASGVDTAGRIWAERQQIPCRSFPADWKRHGKRAGYIRNKQMRDEGKPDLVIAFSGGQGTKNMIDLALQVDIPVVRLGDD